MAVDPGGMDSTLRWLRTAAVTCVLAVAAIVVPSPVWAQDEPPDVRGLPVTEATTQLERWNKAVFFIYEPPPDSGLEVDPSEVVVARMQWRGTLGAASARPVVTLVLGRRVPDLTGMTRQQAEAAIDGLEFVLVANPAPADWLVDSQRPEAGTIVEFTPANTVTVSLADPAGSVPEDPWWRQPAAFVVGGSSLAALALLVLLGTAAVRRARRRQRRRQAPPVERIEVRVIPGPVVGPELVERSTR